MTHIVLTVAIPAFRYKAGVERIIREFGDRDDIEILISEDVLPDEDGIQNLPVLSCMKHWTNMPPLGAVGNWNSLLRSARGQFVWVLHHDEVPKFPSGLTVFLRHLQQTDADLLISHLKYETEGYLQRFLRSDIIRRKLLKNPRSLLLHNYIGSPSNLIVRKNQVQEFDENLEWFVDTEWFVRQIVSANSIELSKFEVCTAVYENSITTTLGEKVTAIALSEIDYICRKRGIGRPFRRIWRIKSQLRAVVRRKNST